MKIELTTYVQKVEVERSLHPLEFLQSGSVALRTGSGFTLELAVVRAIGEGSLTVDPTPFFKHPGLKQFRVTLESIDPEETKA